MHLQSHDDAVDLVKEVFRSMGGTVVPPRRPRHIEKYSIIVPDRDAFIMDFENSCLGNFWARSRPHPKGQRRHENAEWAAMIQAHVFPHHSDIDWEEYVDWCLRGFGDEWFQEEDIW